MVGASRRTSMSARRRDHRATRTCARRRPWRTLWQSVTWLFLVSLASCSWSPRPIVAEPHLSASVVGQVVQAAGPYRIADAFRDYVELTCSVFEAAECWFGETYLQTPLPEDLTGQVIEEVGRGFVANGESNQVWLRCSRSVDGAATCEVDLGRGFGWEPLAVDR